MKKLIALLLALCMLLTMAACGSGKEETPDPQQTDPFQDAQTQATEPEETEPEETEPEETEPEETEPEETEPEETEPDDGLPDGTLDVVYFPSSNRESAVIGEPETSLDPQKVYDSITYVPEMFYGDHRIMGGSTAEEAFSESVEYIQSDFGHEAYISAVPYRFCAGLHSGPAQFQNENTHDWATVYFWHYKESTDRLYSMSVICAYTVEGDTLTLTPVEEHQYDSFTGTVTYKLKQTSLSYTFSFQGLELTLSDGQNEVTLRGGVDTDGLPYFHSFAGYQEADSEGIANLDRLEVTGYYLDGEWHSRVEIGLENALYTSLDALAEMTSDGLFTLSIHKKIGDVTYQMVYFYLGYDGLILTDGEKVYYYTASMKEYEQAQQLKDNLEQGDVGKLEDMTEDQLEQIIEKKADLMEDLANAYQAAGLKVTINETTGEVALDSTVLFGVNEYQVSDEGKDFLKQFMDVYTKVVFDEKYADFLSTIMIEGHTDTNGDYDMNKKLSQDRADSVMAFCLSDECGVDAAYTQALAQMTQSVGYSYDRPVYDRNGNVDMEASRRVSFRFLIVLEG